MQILVDVVATTTIQAHLAEAWLAADDGSTFTSNGEASSPQAPGAAPAKLRSALALVRCGTRLEDVRPLVGAWTPMADHDLMAPMCQPRRRVFSDG
jgi:hypothetical protein